MGEITTTGGNLDTTAGQTGLKMGQVELMLASLKALPTTPIATHEAREATIATIKSLSNPAPRAWLQGEVAKTLVHYFAGAIPKNFSKSIGADYDAELKEFPAWAIVKARRWWLSSDNEFRHRKPLPGDLSARASIEVAVLRYAKFDVRRFDRLGPPEENQEPRLRQDLIPEQISRRREFVAEVMAAHSGGRENA